MYTLATFKVMQAMNLRERKKCIEIVGERKVHKNNVIAFQFQK